MKLKNLFVTTMLVSSLFSITIFSVDGLITRELYTLTIKDSAEEVWNVTIQCDTSGDLNDYVTFGEALDANDGPPEDIYDVVKPPVPPESYVRAWFNDDLPSPYDALFSDYRQYPDSSKVWNLTVQWMPSSGSSPTTITLSWDTTEVDDSEYGTVTLCNESGTPLQNMLMNSSYLFSCSAYVRLNFTIICSNNPPVLGTPTPSNSSIGNPLGFTWSIPINDPDGDAFDWTIQCSNGQVNSGVNATNGIKSLFLSGLARSTTYKVWINATDTGSGNDTRKWYTFTTTTAPNNSPNTPSRPLGQTSGRTNRTYTYTTNTIDPDGDKVFYLWDWGDGTNSTWLGPYDSGVTMNTQHNWPIKDSYIIKVMAKDIYGNKSAWSDPLPIQMPFSYNSILDFLELLFQRFPNAFPLLRQLMGY
jgi:hypothetical protein